jgi:hypothetical protein
MAPGLVRLSKARQRKLIQCIFLFVIISVIAFAFLASWDIAFAKTRSHVKSRLKLALNPGDPFTQSLSAAFEKGLTTHFTHCRASDATRPGTGECIDEFGFSATILESLQTSVLLDHGRLFSHSRDFLKTSFNCSRLGFVNRHEFWSRGIGSLVGTFLMTGDQFFLSKAEQCADRLLRFTRPWSLVHLADLTGKDRGFEDGPSPSDLTAGLPELLALAKITGNRTYWLLPAGSLSRFLGRGRKSHGSTVL